MDPVFPEIKSELTNRHLISKTQIVVLALVLILAGVFFLNRQFRWFGWFQRERVAIPSGQPYVEATVIGAYEGVVLAERVVLPNADKKVSTLPKKLEILTDEKTAFAKLTSSGPIKISRKELSEGDVIWVYKHIRSLEETIAEPADPVLAVPFAEMLKNPRERIAAGYIVMVSVKK